MDETDPSVSARHAGGRFSRRTLLKGIGGAGALLGASALTAGCGSALGAGLTRTQLDPNSITYWNLFGGGDGVRMVSMEDTYQAAHGSGSLTSSTFAWGDPYYTKLILATVGHQAPDVAVAHLTRMQNLAQASLLTPITDEMLSSVGLSGSSFNPLAWANQKRDGQNYAIPLDTHPLVMFYNAEVCKKAGLLDSNGKLKKITGESQWEAALAAASKATGGYAFTCANVSETATPWRLFQTWYWQRNGAKPFLSNSGQNLTVSEPDAIATLKYMDRMRQKGWLAPATDYAGAETMMFTGKAAFYMEGEWEITTAQGISGLKFGMVPVPQIWDKPAAQADSHTFVLPKKDRTDAQTLRSMTFIKQMLDQSQTWAEGGHVPAYLRTLSSAKYKALEPQSDYVSAAEHAVYDPLAWYSGSGSVFENIVGSQIALVQQGQVSPQAGLGAAIDQLQPYLSAQNPL